MIDQTQAEAQLLDRALLAFKKETGLTIHTRALEVLTDDGVIDAIIEIDGNKREKLNAEIKAWAQHVNTGALINQIRHLGKNGILITDYVNPKLAERLKMHEIQFMDTAGNAFIRVPGIHIYVTGKKRTDKELATGAPPTQLFNPTGLKVTYILLRDPNMVNNPYRDIADEANVALGTVGAVMRDLKNGKFLVERGKRRQLRNYEKLLNRWVETYPEKLKPKLHVGRFVAAQTDWWKNLPITNFKAQWGGEIAAAKYTEYLRPEVATIYLENIVHLAELIKAARLRKLNEFTASDGMEVNIFERFWNFHDEDTALVDPVLTFADLIATGDPRNREVAQEIKRKYLDKRIREN